VTVLILILRWLFYAAYKEKTNDSGSIATKMLPRMEVAETACCGSDSTSKLAASLKSRAIITTKSTVTTKSSVLVLTRYDPL
jgi:hypothetical protein